MKHLLIFLLFILPFIPAHITSAAASTPPTTVILTSAQVTSAVDIEAAIIRATAQGTRPGMVILDGKEGPFILSGPDRSLNIFVSNLTLRGVHSAILQDCDDGLFFDDFPLKHILVEEITLRCSGDGVEATGAFHDVTLRGLIIQAGKNGISLGGASSGWLITNNLIQAGGDGTRISGAAQMVITNNHLAGTIAVTLLSTSAIQVRRNALQASYQGVLLGQETWGSTVQGNTILGVSASGIALEPGVVRNRVLANTVVCANNSACLTVDATPAVARLNTIGGNRP
jgi:hypothetical protein